MAEMSDFRRAPVGCVAVIGNKVFATGFSQHKTHPLQMYYNRFRDFSSQTDIEHKMHAEMVVISQLRMKNIDFSKISIYVYRLCRSRDAGIARPCNACMRALKNLGIKNVFYTTDFGYAYEHIA
jgi:deoxycytidylate deaminase